MKLSTKYMGVALSSLTLTGAVGQSCVQVTEANVTSACPCAQASIEFTLEGQTSVAANTVNLALIVDGSSSISPDNFEIEKNFTKQTVAAFASRNLFDNGGEASYVQYSNSVISSATFNSSQDFNDFVDADTQARQGTMTATGINEGTQILLTNPASASFMIVITDGASGDDPETAADDARAEGIVVFAVGVGAGVDQSELLGIAGNESNLFKVDDFDALDAALESILSSDGGSVIPCPSTNAAVVVEYSSPVDASSGGSVSGNTVTFTAPDLEDTATEFDVVLDLCGQTVSDNVVVSASYTDDQGNSPDLSFLTGIVIGSDLCEDTTQPPTPAPAGKDLEKDSAKDATYIGCYVNNSKNKALSLAATSNKMTAQWCADKCEKKDAKYFATSASDECFCGTSEPNTDKKGKCDYPCAGDDCVACGGHKRMSVFKFDKNNNGWNGGGNY